MAETGEERDGEEIYGCPEQQGDFFLSKFFLG